MTKNCIDADEFRERLERVIRCGIETDGKHRVTAEFMLEWVNENSFKAQVDDEAKERTGTKTWTIFEKPCDWEHCSVCHKKGEVVKIRSRSDLSNSEMSVALCHKCLLKLQGMFGEYTNG